MSPLSVLETCLYVHDLRSAEQFYSRVLRLELLGRRPGRHIFFRCGSGVLLLFDAAATASTSEVPSHGARGPGHVAFAIQEGELERWQDHLAECHVAIERIVDWPQGGRSLYFRDPSSNSLELTLRRIWQLES